MNRLSSHPSRKTRHIQRELALLLYDKRHNEQRHNVNDFNHRIDRRTSRILIGIADGVTGDCRLVGICPLLPLLFDVLLGVVLGAAAACHRDGDE